MSCSATRCHGRFEHDRHGQRPLATGHNAQVGSLLEWPWFGMSNFKWLRVAEIAHPTTVARLIAANRRTERHLLFEGQMRCSFVLEAAAAAGIAEFILILVDCDDATRIRRLTLERRQPDLVNPTMMSWARYLRNEAHQLHCTILDTTLLSLEECVKQIWTQFSR
jgi:hypothetical protein